MLCGFAAAFHVGSISNLDLFNKMHIRRIGLTGGEPTLHPDFVEIVLFFLKNDFEVCVFSNGYNFNIIENLLKVSRDFRYKTNTSHMKSGSKAA